jgi:integrase/recombinase XerD
MRWKRRRAMTDTPLIIGESLFECHYPNAPLIGLIGQYVLYFAQGEGSTARAKRQDLLKLADYFGNVAGLADLNHSNLCGFVEWLSKHEAVATVRRRWATVRHFCKVLAMRLPDFYDPTLAVPVPRQEPSSPQSLDSRQRKQLINAYDGEDIWSLRNRAIIATLFYSGMRISELCDLKREQLKEGVFYSVRTKGNYTRDIKVSDYGYIMLQQYTAARDVYLPIAKKQSAELFVSRKYHKMNPRSVNYIIYEACELVGIPLVSAHKLRHSFAYALHAETHDVALVQRALGHSSLQTTTRYVVAREAEVFDAIGKLQ